MSGHTLPDDPARWPDNPYHLLGVSPGVGSRELRRAYTRLIRTYKPEQYPEQFRLIREAYDQLLPIAEMFGDREIALDATVPATEETPQFIDTDQNDLPPTTEKEVPDNPIVVNDSQNPVSTELEIRRIPTRGLEDELNELWESAIGGQEQTTYRRLMELSHQHPGKVDIYLRLYWLLTTTPDLDPNSLPADWLVRGILATGLPGPLQELYREEVTANPAEALGDRFKNLLKSSLPLGVLADLAELRLRAATRFDCWDLLSTEVQQFGKKFGNEDEAIWLRILFGLADELAWVNTPAANKIWYFVNAEIKRCEYLSARISWAFDRFDLLKVVTQGWVKLRRLEVVPEGMLNLIRLSWPSPFDEDFNRLLQSFIGQIAQEPEQWLPYFDRMHNAAPDTLALFGQLLNRKENELDYPVTLPLERDILIAQVKEFLAELMPAMPIAYAKFRIRLLKWCLHEALDPGEVADVAAGLSEKWANMGNEFAHIVRRDWPVRYIVKSCLLFRA